MRIALVEDDPAVAADVARELRPPCRHRLAWQAASLEQASACLAHPFDVLLLDLGLPDGRGTQLIPQVRTQAPRAQVVAFTVFDDESNVLEAIEAGVDGYALKNTRGEALLEVIDSVLRGESPISAAVAGFLLKRLRRSERAAASASPRASSRPPQAEALTPREREVLEMLARGLSYQETANVLGIGASTVAHHVRSLYPKLYANSRSEAVFNALRDGLIRL